MIKVKGTLVQYEESELKQDVTMLFHSIIEELGIEKWREVLTFAYECLINWEKYNIANHELKEEKKNKKLHVIKAHNINEAIKITKDLDIPEEVKNMVIKELKEMK